ncbi:MAG: oxidoreductase [Dethiosulfovibrio peptidovorans]|nr:MAG: oxidoreductase [Dethiosulfovibrio peptidovorans]
MNRLFSPIQIGPITLPNRIILPPMCQFVAKDGKPTPWHIIHYGQMVCSGAGLIILEATAVCPEGRISPFDLGLWSDETEEAMAHLLASIRPYASMPLAIQLAHAGRKGSCSAPWDGSHLITPENGGWVPVAPSPLAYGQGAPLPSELSEEKIQDVIQAFTDAAYRADRLGFDAVEIHAAHGYLLHQFLSSLSNRRHDRFGGSLENRMRLTLEVLRSVRKAVPHSVIGVRISATDWVPGGWDLDQSTTLVRQLRHLGCDYIHVSSGGLSPEQIISLHPGYQLPFASRIKADTGLPTIAVGLITQAEHADSIVSTGKTDMVAIGRAMLFNPRWPWHAAACLGTSIQVPEPYRRSAPSAFPRLFQQ